MGFIIHRAAGEHTLLRQVSGDALRVGRDAGAGLRLDDDAVALDHAVIRAEGGGWLIEDHGSVTGTYLNGEPVERARLAAGDLVEIGGYRLKVQITHPDDPLFVHVAAVGAGAAEAPRPARGSATGSLRLDELLARVRESGKPPPVAVTDTGPLHRLAEIAAAAGGRGAPARRRREPPPDEGTALRRLGEIAAEVEARAEEVARARAAVERETAAIPIPAAREPAAPPRPAAAEPAPEEEHETGAVAIPAEPEQEQLTGPVALPAAEPEVSKPARAEEQDPATVAIPAAIPAAVPAKPSVAPPPRPSEAAPREPERPAPAPAAAVPTPSAAPRIDYASAYALARPGLTKGTLTLLVTAAAVVMVAALAAGGEQTWFMPGISSAHARIVGAPVAMAGEGGAAPADPSGGPPSGTAAAVPAADPRRREIERRGCLACHRPWRGPTAVADGCAACHSANAAPHAEILAAASPVPVCAECHAEHRDRPLVFRGDDALCLGCHRDLGAVVTAAGAAPAVAARVTSFAADHPELVIEVAAPGGGVRRIPLDDPAAKGADPGILDFDHRLHRVHAAGESPLEPSPLRGPQGPTTLECGACHGPDERTGRMQPVVFEEHCASCHRLTFDARYPDCQARHGAPAQVQEFLLATYALERCPDETAAPAGGAGSIFDRRGRLGTPSILGDARRRRALEAEATEAAVTLFRSACDVCHRVDLDAVPLPTVEPPRLPEAWMPGAGFSHLDHDEFGCGECHAAAAASAETADVLLPGIAACRACHGEDESAAGWGGRLGCGECHAYHRPGGAALAALAGLAATEALRR